MAGATLTADAIATPLVSAPKSAPALFDTPVNPAYVATLRGYRNVAINRARCRVSDVHVYRTNGRAYRQERLDGYATWQDSNGRVRAYIEPNYYLEGPRVVSVSARSSIVAFYC